MKGKAIGNRDRMVEGGGFLGAFPEEEKVDVRAILIKREAILRARARWGCCFWYTGSNDDERKKDSCRTDASDSVRTARSGVEEDAIAAAAVAVGAVFETTSLFEEESDRRCF